MTTVLMCPDCHHRIGNYRSGCPTCNTFAAAVRTGVANKLRSQFTGDLTTLTEQTQTEVFTLQHGAISATNQDTSP